MPFFKLRGGRSTKSMQRLDDNDDDHLHIGEIQSTNKQPNTTTLPVDTNNNNKISYTMTQSPHTYNPQPPQGRYNNNTNSASSYQSQQSSNASQSTTDISRDSNKIFTSALFTTSKSGSIHDHRPSGQFEVTHMQTQFGLYSTCLCY